MRRIKACNKEQAATGSRQLLRDVVTSFVNGGTPDTDDPALWEGTIPWVTGSDFENQKVILGRRFISADALQKSATNVIPKGHILLLSRTGIGKFAIAPCDLAVSQDITGLIVDHAKCSPSFLFWQLNARASLLARWSQGTSIQGIQREDLEVFPIVLPNLKEQGRVAALFDLLDAAITSNRGSIEQKSQLACLLVENWITDISKDPAKMLTLSRCIRRGPQNGVYCHESLYGSGIPILRINDFDSGTAVSSTPSNRVQLEPADIGRYQLVEGDLLVNRVNSISHLGKTAMVESLAEPVVFESNMMRFSLLHDVAIPRFALLMLGSQFVRSQIRGMAKRAIAQCSIDQSDLRSIRLPVPPIDEQIRLVEIIDSLAFAVHTQSRYLCGLQSLKSALYQQLFT